jgi:hypothetical protein
MTLGRTSTGAIKIKTDSPGLRAVECACCGSECGCATVSAQLRTTIESATTIAVNGSTGSWNGERAIVQLGFGQLSWGVSYSTGQICVYGDNGDNTVRLGEGCLFTTGPDIQINGESFTASHAFNQFQLSMDITFS